MHARAVMFVSFAAAGFVVCGCSTRPEAPDTTPSNTTAVFETLMVNSGIMGMLPFEISAKNYVRANMRREEHATKGTGTFTGWLVTAVTGEGDTSVVRLDSDKLWTINNGKKEYTECPAHGCPVPPRETKPTKPEAQREEPKQQAEKGCTARIASNSFDVKDTGATRQINGFGTNNYTVAWVVKLRDPQKRETVSTLSADVWTTPVSDEMRRAFNTEAAFARAYGASARQAPKSNANAQAIPPEVTGMMGAYLTSLSPADRAAITNIGTQLSKIRGYPIQTKIEWRLAGDACAPKEGQQQQSKPTATGSVTSALGSLFGAKKDEKPGDTPILSFTFETKAVKVEPVRDSVFAVPAGYKRMN